MWLVTSALYSTEMDHFHWCWKPIVQCIKVCISLLNKLSILGTRWFLANSSLHSKQYFREHFCGNLGQIRDPFLNSEQGPNSNDIHASVISNPALATLTAWFSFFDFAASLLIMSGFLVLSDCYNKNTVVCAAYTTMFISPSSGDW